MKICNHCKLEKDYSEFHKHPQGLGGVRGTCKDCILNGKNRREKQIKKRYGITIEEYKTLFYKQNQCCAICKKHQSEFDISLAVDHCHITNKVRGLLCYNCNMGLGRFKDNINYLKEAISYLERGY